MKSPEILEGAYRAWSSAATLRLRRERYKNYTYGKQWCDTVRDMSGRYVPEQEVLEASGVKPLSNNLIRQLVKTVVGRYRTKAAEEGQYESGDVSELARRNCLSELDSRLLEEFLISGCAIQRIVDERRWEGCGVWVDNVDPRRFFVNQYCDPRGSDIELIGMLHDISFAELVNRFACGSKERVKRFRHIYSGGEPESAFAVGPELGSAADPADFFNPAQAGRCRVIEVCTFDSRETGHGADLEFVWHCRMLAPDGSVLHEYDSAFGHGSHPFVVKMYPLTDGEVHSFVEDVIDQQRYINRLIVMMDKILTTSAKGVLLFPVDQKADNVSWDDITRVWARSDGVIPIRGTGTYLPQQVVTNTSNPGAYQLLQLQMKLFEDISGVGDALLGRSDGSARGADMLDSQIRNATIALADIFETFNSFITMRNAKALRVSGRSA